VQFGQQPLVLRHQLISHHRHRAEVTVAAVQGSVGLLEQIVAKIIKINL